MIDVDATFASIFNSIVTGKPGEATAITAASANRSKRAELVRSRIPSQAINASVETGIKEVVFIEERSGVEFNVQDLEQALSSKDNIAILPVTLHPAEMTVEDLRELIFRDVLAEFTTYYNSPWGRTNNIRLATNKVNETILSPQAYFSFNQVVGRRTRQAGFAMGGVFIGDRIAEGIGGGICQVSTTIYCAALLADLNIVQRHNHSFAIGYAPLGQDAAVSYGTLDLVFQNDTEFPIKVVAINGPGRVTIRILGTNVDPEKSVRIENVRIASRPFNTVERVNPDPNATRNVVDQAGISGFTVDSYKVIRRNGVIESRDFLHRSVYVPLNQIVLTPQVRAPIVPIPDLNEETPPPVIET
jgi:vancomycin resistance protein YoaR